MKTGNERLPNHCAIKKLIGTYLSIIPLEVCLSYMQARRALAVTRMKAYGITA